MRLVASSPLRPASFVAVARLADHLHSVESFQQGAQPGPHQNVVVGDHDAKPRHGNVAAGTGKPRSEMSGAPSGTSRSRLSSVSSHTTCGRPG